MFYEKESNNNKVLLLMALVLIMFICIYSFPGVYQGFCNLFGLPGRAMDAVMNMDMSMDVCNWELPSCE